MPRSGCATTRQSTCARWPQNRLASFSGAGKRLGGTAVGWWVCVGRLPLLLLAVGRALRCSSPHATCPARPCLHPTRRQASGPAIRVGAKAVLAEAVTRPNDARVHAAGALLAEAATGVSHGLHSRAAAVLGPVLREGLLRPEDFKSAKVGIGRRRSGSGRSCLWCPPERWGRQRAGWPRPTRPPCPPHLQAKAGGRTSEEQIQSRVAAALSVCIEQLAVHTRRGKCGELWQLLLAEADSRLARLVAAQQARGGAGGEELAAAAASAARGLALLAQLVEHGRGCRVENYAPLFQLAARLVQPEFVGCRAGSGSGSDDAAAPGDGGQAAVPGLAPLPLGASAVASDFLRPSLSAQVLRLMLALARSHAKVAGASEGPAALARAAPVWAPAFLRAPPEEVLPFTRALISWPAGFDVARPFGQQMLGALGRCLLAGESSPTGVLEMGLQCSPPC